ncbi:MAG: DUF6600 domain-containing protein [Luteolibacter sp.]|uniref:DUF6600 domain-containing protein n=1 Tax=Luteolibacter sp. TaxID=1962973 RepID=UPI00326412DD
MKTPSLLPIAVVVLFAASGCNKQSSENSKKIAELEQKNSEAADRQRELEQQLEDQKLATERDAIERERAQIENDRAELERQQGQAAADQDEELRQREEAIAKREGKLEKGQELLDEKEDTLSQRDQNLTDRDRELAGREALDFDSTEQNVPVGDYGNFYDSLSSYGSWFETSNYGYVWQPAVVREVNWRPYCRGRWACSDRGWTWVSEEPFGWATYHYGRWALIGGRGWVWVPGTEWAPCWVSWRENDSHIGWAPLPPETMAYRGRGWDATVDVQFGIAAACFNFVEIRHFGSPLYRYCLPISGNGGWFGQTINITYIHIQNRQVICGGPHYQRISDRIGKPLPFYRLEIDQHPRPARDQLAMRPQVNGGRLRIAAPNMDAAWNDSLRPKQVRGRIETVNVERSGPLSNEITDKFRQTREEGRARAEQSIADLGGNDRFEESRSEKLRENRREVEGTLPRPERRGVARNPDRPQRDMVDNRDDPKVSPPEREKQNLPDGVTRGTKPDAGRPGIPSRQDDSQVRVEPRAPRTPEPKEQVAADGKTDGPRVIAREPSTPQEKPDNRRQPEPRVTNDRQTEQSANNEKDTANRRQQEQAQQQQRQAEQAREAQNDAMRRRQEDQAQQQQEKQRQQDEAREARKQAMEEQREQARQQQQQQAQDEARRQQQEQREMQRQQEQAQQRQEEARQRQQEEAQQRQQEQARQQREQEQSRQQEEARQRQQEQSRQQQQKDDDDQKKRNR